MVQPGHIVRALIASPSDVSEERDAIKEVIFNWNATHSYRRAISIEPVLWESHSTPLQGERPQGQLNKQLGNKSAFLIAIFWVRIGTDTGVAVSGTVEEIQEFEKAGKPVLIYYSDRAVPPSSIDQEQQSKLEAFKKERRSTGLQYTYSTIPDFREKLNKHLTDVIDLLNIGEISADTKQQDNRAESHFLKQFGKFLSRFKTEWTTEQRGIPPSSDNGKLILESKKAALTELLSSADDLTNAQNENIQDLLIKINQTSQMLIGIGDSGKARDLFWSNGEAIIEELENFYDEAKQNELLKSAPVLLTAEVAYKKESIIHSNPQYTFNICIKGHNRTKAKINDYRMIVSIPKSLLLNNQFGRRLGKRLPDRDTPSCAVFEFPNAKENAVTLFPDENEPLGEISCILHKANINDQALKEESITVDFFTEASGRIKCSFAIADLDPFNLKTVNVEQLQHERIYSLPVANPEISLT